MTTAYWCVLAAALMPILWAVIAKSSQPGFNNKRPREFLASLEGFGARANAAQLNSFEAFPLFAAGVIIAHQVGVMEQELMDILALSFIGARLLFGVFYLTNKHLLRSLAWTAAIGCSVTYFIMSV